MTSQLGTWWQKSRLHSWWKNIGSWLGWLWQQIQQHPFVAILLVLLIALIAFALAVHWSGWDWTGLTGYSPPTPQYQRGKTLWDWLQLLVIPLMLAIGGFWLNQLQKDREQRASNERAEREKRETEQRAMAEREAAEQRAQTEYEIAADNQREAALQAYIDNMSELLLEKKLRDSATGDEIRKIARVRTLTVLHRLDRVRKGSVIRFLYESGLVDKEKCIISLHGADLRFADLRGAYLGGADLNGTDLHGADLREAWLIDLGYTSGQRREADLRFADLHGADLRGAHLSECLSGANLSGANLSGTSLLGADLYRANLHGTDLHGANLRLADLQETNLREANLHGADLHETALRGADLKGAIGITVKELMEQAKSLWGATMPDGSQWNPLEGVPLS